MKFMCVSKKSFFYIDFKIVLATVALFFSHDANGASNDLKKTVEDESKVTTLGENIERLSSISEEMEKIYFSDGSNDNDDHNVNANVITLTEVGDEKIIKANSTDLTECCLTKSAKIQFKSSNSLSASNAQQNSSSETITQPPSATTDDAS